MWLSAKTHGMRFPELFLGGHAEKKNVGSVRSGRVLCDRAEVRTLHQLCGPGAHHFRASLAGRVGVTRPGLHPPPAAHPLFSPPYRSRTWPWAATTTTSPCTRWRSVSDSGPSPQAALYIRDPPRCREHWPELAAEGSRGPALSVCLSSLSCPGAQRRGLCWSPWCDGRCSAETRLPD